jgi:hypothetical protein
MRESMVILVVPVSPRSAETRNSAAVFLRLNSLSDNKHNAYRIVTARRQGPAFAASDPRTPEIVAEGPIGERFCEIDPAHCILALEVRESARDPQDAVITARRDAQGVGRLHATARVVPD